MNDTTPRHGNGTVAILSSSCDPGEFAASRDLQMAISCVQFLGLPANGYVAWLILSGSGGGTPASELFYLNLTAAVIVFCPMPAFHLAWIFTGSCVARSACYFILFLFLFAVPAFQCCVCVERYLAVVRPVAFQRHNALRHRVCCCCAEWLAALALSAAWFWTGTDLFYVLLGFYLLHIAAVSFCCLSVLRTLKRPGPGAGGSGGNSNSMKRRAFRIILVSLVVMLLTLTSFIPFCLTELHYPPAMASNVTYTLGSMSVHVHPLLYLHKAGRLPCSKGSPGATGRRGRRGSDRSMMTPGQK